MQTLPFLLAQADPTSWLQVVKELGFPVALCLLLLAIYARYLHPYLVSKDTANQASQDKFLEAVERIANKNAEGYNKMADAINELKIEIRSGKRAARADAARSKAEK